MFFNNVHHDDDDDGDDDGGGDGGGVGGDDDESEQSYGFAQSDSCVKQTSETDGRQKRVLADEQLGGGARARHVFLASSN